VDAGTLAGGLRLGRAGARVSPPVPEGPVFAELTGAPGPTVLTAVVGEAG